MFYVIYKRIISFRRLTCALIVGTLVCEAFVLIVVTRLNHDLLFLVIGPFVC